MEMLKIVLRSLSESTDTRAVEDVKNRPIVGHLLIHSSYTQTSQVRDIFAFYLTLIICHSGKYGK